MKATDAKTHLDVIEWMVKFYRPTDWSEESTNGYLAKLSKYPLSIVAVSASKLIETSSWMPRLSEWLDDCKKRYNRLLEIEASRRVLIEHQGEPLDVREAVKEAAWEGVKFAEALAAKWKREAKHG